ncbi:MAG: type II secretion system protein [Zetaproteobacteria bacterium]|nr:MAG: type II secretion system protein [Zetaproteobacteria bacterium]
MRRFSRKGGKGFTLIELLIAVAIISVLAMIAIPNVIKASRKSRYARAASETRMVTTSAMTYVLDKGVYPTSIGLLRSNGYGGMGDLDPWKIPYELSPVLLGGGPAVSGQDVYTFSKGASGAGVYPDPFLTYTGPGGSVGYSSIYGAWAGD